MKLHNEDLAKLIIRLAAGGLMIFHGVHKLVHGHEFVANQLETAGLPTMLVLGVPIGEVLAPLMLMLGLQTRIAALVLGFTMLMSIYLVFWDRLFTLNQVGGWAPELNAFFILACAAIFFQGAGKYSLDAFFDRKKSLR